ncbi:hypothetical protein [Actinophytocola xanthii]|uniref:FXSXX-COOH protein n=1 Tax=Actinophytocola xanthii TaxID=1912961 RepID=A0A1Q8CGS4_9PSEU|nr:hypothetical protein [Actinophytocola xanthii]OLF13556.1 hypothetical protein BU204_26850 [Actinophytocola xanthii]
MNSSPADLEPGIESQLVDLSAVPFTRLRDLDTEALRRSQNHVVERTRGVRASYPSNEDGGGERID